MYLFTRQARLTGADALKWAATIRDHVAVVTESEVQLWASTLSPGFGTVTWSSSWDDLASLETSFAKLVGNSKYLSLAAEGAQFVNGGVDDGLYQSLYDGTGESGPVQLISSIQAVCANGQLTKALANGVEIAQKAEAISGRPTMFLTTVTGNYGGVGWLAGYESLAAFEQANAKLNADTAWLTYLDGATTCYAQDVGATQSSLHRLVP
ncbi:MAG TPA: hypothetical protein VNF05_10380 [Acidimicrobiales bacterium]|nr:hypothetical protein [Acidimicrobiales bacterium]